MCPGLTKFGGYIELLTWLSKARFERSLSGKHSESHMLGFAYKKPEANAKALLKRALY